MKKAIRYVMLMAVVVLLCGACSRKGVHMPKHRKKAHCNCPTFTQVPESDGDGEAYFDPEV